MATVYLKKVESSSRSEWASGTSYVVGDRVWIEDASTVVSFTNSYGDHNNNAIRTYVCIKDTSSATSPLNNTTDWTEAGTKEYPYHSVGGNLTNSNISPESYLEATNDRYATTSNDGSLFHHLRRGESGYSLGKLILLADEEYPLFLATTSMYVAHFELEPDPSIKRIRIHFQDGSIGSNIGHADYDSVFGRVKKCDLYFSGNLPSHNIIGGIYSNLSKIEFDECYFGSGEKIGLGAPTNANYLNIGTRNFLGLNLCTVDFPNTNINYISWDAKSHSTGVRSYIKNSTLRFKSAADTDPLIQNSHIDVENSIFYFDSLGSNTTTYSTSATYAQNLAKDFVVYVKDESLYTLDENGGSFTGTVTKIDPKFVDDSGDYRLRANSPLIGGLKTSSEQSKLESQYPDGKWFDANAAAGGDGSWATPYDSLFDAIDSFSGVNTATVLVKEGDHPMYQGWDNSISGTPAQVHSKIEIIGINSNARFTTEDNLNNYCQFYLGSGSFDDTEFFYKNIDFHINNATGYINRGLLFNPKRNKFSLHQCKITQSSTGEIMTASIFYQAGTDDANPAEIELIGLEYIAVNWRTQYSDYSAIFNPYCKVAAKNCTFFEPERSMLRTTHTHMKSVFLGRPHSSSIFENCIFRSDIEYGTGAYSSRQFFSPQTNFYSGIYSTLGLFKNCSISSKYGSFTDNANYDFRLYNYQENCSHEDPKFVNAALGSEDIRLQASSPLIGGTSGNSSEEKWIARATKENATYAFFDPQATGTGDGSSLVDACTDLFEAIAAVDYGGYIFVADMDWTTTSLRITKPVQIQALNPGKAIWRVMVNQQNLQIQPTGYQLGINITSGGGDGEYTFSGASTSGHTKNIDGYYTGDRIVFDGSSTTAQANDYYTVANHTFDGTTHSFTLNEPLNGAVSGSTTIWQEINSTGDSAIRDMVLIDFNTFSTAQGNGITFQPTSKNNTVAATTSYGKMVFERNKVLQTLNNSISGNNKTGLYFRNDHNSVLGTRFDVNGNCFSFRPYTGSSSVRFYPMNMGGNSFLSISDAENRFCHNNSVYVYNDRDANADFGNGLGLGFNSIFVIDNQYGGVSTQAINTTFIDQNNYFYGLTGSDSVASQELSINPFIDAVNGDFRIRPSSELLGRHDGSL